MKEKILIDEIQGSYRNVIAKESSKELIIKTTLTSEGLPIIRFIVFKDECSECESFYTAKAALDFYNSI